jgi:hypothetical protein
MSPAMVSHVQQRIALDQAMSLPGARAGGVQ